MSDPLIARLADLPGARPDPARAARTKTRCRAQLARHAAHAARADVSRSFAWQPLLAGLGVAYLIATIAQAFELLSSQF
jgi:hypothetical protein